MLLSEPEGEVDTHGNLRRCPVERDEVAVDAAAVETVRADEQVEARTVDVGQDAEAGTVGGYMAGEGEVEGS